MRNHFARLIRSRRLHIAGGLFAALLLVAGVAAYQWLLADLPPVTSVELRASRPTSQILDRHGRLLYEVVDPDAGKQIDLSLANIPRACVDATLATEDERFFSHFGVDPVAIARAVWQNINGRTVVSGGSTLTQQLARTLLLSPEERYEQSLHRKLREAWLAWQLERHYSKDQLLALYLNQTYYGNFAFGLEAAAQIFFAKPAAQLSTAECALLAGLVQYPTGYNPLADPQTAKNRQLTVLRLMQESGYLDAASATQVADEPLAYRSHLFDVEAPHFVMYVQSLLAEQLGPARLRDGGLRVWTTLDLDLQRQAEAAVQRRLGALTCRDAGVCKDPAGRDRRVDNAAAVILDSETGAILSMIGSPNYFDQAIAGNVNAALSPRQPGSAIKPFTYAAALDPNWSAQGGVPPLTTASILPDLPTTFYVENAGGEMAAYRPQNYDRIYHGPVSVRTALANSYNIPAVDVLDRVGVETLRELASQAGIRTFTGRYGLALTLGGGDVRLLDLTSAFGIFDDGRTLPTTAILAVEAADSGGTAGNQRSGELPRNLPSAGNLVSAGQPQARGAQVITPQTAYLITDILSDDVARQPAFGRNSVLTLPFPAAVKTGTTTDWRDNWTVGYSTRRLVGVWVGNADNSPMVDVSGVDGAGPIWHDLMLLAHATPPPAFVRPPKIVDVEVCAPSGLLPGPACPRTRWERFLAGTAPTQPDNQFQRLAIDLATGELATEATPANRRAERVYWLLGPEYHDWMLSQGIALAPAGAGAAVADAAPGSTRPTSAASTPPAPLQLASPVSYTAYQVHPGLPGASQQLEAVGYTADGRAWSSLRLVVNGSVIAEGANVARLRALWPMALGPYAFWLEGEREPGGETVRSQPAQISVDPFTDSAVTMQVVD
jgi:penicillin-binding protein 1C